MSENDEALPRFWVPVIFGGMVATFVALGVYPLAVAALLIGLALACECAPQVRLAVISHAVLFLSLVLWNSRSPAAAMLLGLGLLVVVSLARFQGWPRHSLAMFLMMITAMPLSYLSGQGGGAGGWHDWWIAQFGITFQQADAIIWAIRKGIHFVAYAAIAGTAGWAILREAGRVHQAIRFALVWGCAHAAFDELRQFQTPGRTGSWIDFLIDLAGMMTALALLKSYHQKSS